MKWKLRPQEREGSYFFNGIFLVTRRVHESIPQELILSIYQQVRYLATAKDGLDSVQVFEDQQSGERLYLIDQLNTEMIESGAYIEEDNHCTLLYSHEY